MTQRTTLTLVAFLGLFLSPEIQSAAAEAEKDAVKFDISGKNRIVVKIDDAEVAEYVYEDADISRPYFSNLRTPNGPRVTRTYPPVEGVDRADHGTFHPGLWMSFGDLSGNDYWRLAAPVKQLSYELAPSDNAFTVHNHYLDQKDSSKIVCEENCTYSFIVRPAGYLLLWDSTFSSSEGFYFGDQEEMGIGFRVATPIRVEKASVGTVPAGNGKMIDSQGRINGEKIWGKSAQWCDSSGTLDGQHVGMTLFCHPQNFRPSWFHARDYGLLEANPFGRKAFGKGDISRVEVQPGEKFRLRYGVFVHATSGSKQPDLAAEYANYVQATKQ